MGLVVWDHPWSYRALWPHPTGQGQLNPKGGSSCPGKHLMQEGWDSERVTQINWWQGKRSAVPRSVSLHALLSAMQSCQRWVCHCNTTQKAAVQGADLSKTTPEPTLPWSWPKFHFRPTVKILMAPDQSSEKPISLHKLPVPSHSSVGDCSSLAV